MWLCKFRQNLDLNEREKVLNAVDIWIVKELVWYVTVVITFLLIMMEQGDNMIIGTIASGVVTFIVLYWWRTSQSDHIE